MVLQLREMIDNNQITELELVNFIRTLKKLGKNNFVNK